MSRFDWRTEWPHWTLLGLLVLVAARAPDRDLPVHWGPSLEPDVYAPAWLVPVVGLVLYLILLALPRLDPARANYAWFSGAYRVVRVAVLGFVVAMTATSLAGEPSAPSRLLVGLLLVALGGVLGKIRPNWFVGIRTPWTMTSKRSWLRTHRLAGWLFLGWGLAEIGLGVLAPGLPAPTAVVAAVVTVSLLAYSFGSWRSDPDRVPAFTARPAEPP